IAVLNRGGDPSNDNGTEGVHDHLDVRVFAASPVDVDDAIGLQNVLLLNERYVDSFTADAGDTFTVRVSGDAGDDDANYDLRIWSSEVSDSFGDNNNTQGTAEDLGSINGATSVGSIGTITHPDRDFYEFDADISGEVSVRITMPEGTGYSFGPNGNEATNLGVRIWNDAREIVSTSNGTAGHIDIASFDATNGETYFAEVYSSSFGQVNVYDLDISAVNDGEGRVTGYVFQDDNQSALRDPIEPALANVTVNVDIGANGGVEVTAVTDANGFYILDNLPFGTHEISLAPQAGVYTVYPEPFFGSSYVITIGEDNLNADHLDFATVEADFGDAPDANYDTLLAFNGPRHTARGPLLGNFRDAESDGLESVDALGDDTNQSPDDEDGVLFPNPLLAGTTVDIDVDSSAGGGELDFFFDWNRDGDFDDGNEVYSDTLVGGPETISVAVPAGATAGASFARFRISTAGGLEWRGPASDGEVEDHAITITGPSLTVSLADASVSEADGPGATTGTVTRVGGDHSVVLTVNLSSSDTSEAKVGTTVVIPANQATSLPFNIDAQNDFVVDGTKTVTIGASAAGFDPGAAFLDVTDDDVRALTLVIADASMSENGGASTATVSRNDENLTGPLTVNLMSDDTGEATVVATVTILATQQTSPAFAISAVDDAVADGTQVVTITGSAVGYVDGTDTIDVTDDESPSITLTIAPASVAEGDGAAAATGTVTRNDGDLSNPLVVTLSSDDTTEATVPASVTILANQSSATFDIDAIDDAIVDMTQAVTVTASAAGRPDATGTLDVTDDDSLALSVSISAVSIVETDGVAATTATVTRNDGDLSNPLIVTLVSSDTGEAVVASPVTILANESFVSFNIDAIDDALVDGTQTVTITASAAGGYTDGSDTVDVTDDEVPELTVSISAASVSEGAGAAATTATVTRNVADVSAALTVTLATNDTSEATVQTTVTILANQAFATFDIDAVDDAIVDGPQTVTVTATAAGFSDGTDTVDVTDDDVLTLTVDIVAASISEGAGTGATTGTVTRNAGDLSSAVTVTLSSDDAGEAVPQPLMVTILANDTSATFNIDAVEDVISDGVQTATIKATASGYVSGTDTVDVTDNDGPTLTLSIADASISEGGGFAATTATVSRNDADLSSALTVNVASNDTSEAEPAVTSVTIPIGSSSAPFNIDAVDDAIDDGTQTVTFTASAATYTSGTDTLDVTDDDVQTLTLVIAAASIAEGDGVNATTATVTRNDVDLSSPLTVNIVSDDTSEAEPSMTTVTILANEDSVTFNIDADDDFIVDGTQTPTFTASAGGYVDGTDTINVTDDDVLTLKVTIAAASVSEAAGAAATTGTVSRNDGDLSGELIVTLSSDDGGEANPNPTSVTIGIGQTSANFDIDAVDDATVDGTQTVTITAMATLYVDGDDTVNVTDDDAADLTVVITEASVSEGAGATAANGTVTRNDGDLSNPLTVTLSSNDSTEAVPTTTTVTILATQSSANFTLDAVDDAIVDGTQTVTITATAALHSNGTDTIDIADDDVLTLTLTIDAASIQENAGTGATTATVSRNDGDLSGAVTVNLSSDSTRATVQGTVMIAMGQTTSAPFGIDTVDDALMNGDVTVTITGTATNYVDGADTVDVIDDDLPGFSGRKFHDVNGDGDDESGADPGLSGWTIELYDNNGNVGFDPGSPFGGTAEDTLLQTTVTDSNGNYSFDATNVTLVAGESYVIRERSQAGWHQTFPSPVTHYTNTFVAGTTVNNLDFGNATCGFQHVTADVDITVTADYDGILTLELEGGGTFEVLNAAGSAVVPVYAFEQGADRIDGNDGDDDDGDTTTHEFNLFNDGLSRESVLESGVQRADLISTAGTSYTIRITGSTPNTILRYTSAVNIDGSGNLIVHGSVCGDVIVVDDDPNHGGNDSDAKSIFVGSYAGQLSDFNLGNDLTGQFQGVTYNAEIINATFNDPTIAGVQVFGDDGDDIIRVTDDVVQDASLEGDDGNDIIRAGGGRSTVHGRNGSDFIVGGPVADVLYGDNGNDFIHGGLGGDRIFGGNDNDLLSGGDGDDPLIRGGNGDDILSGGIGRDRLLGDGGNDMHFREVAGTASVDTFVSNENRTDVPTAASGPLVGDPESDLIDLIDRFWDDQVDDGPGLPDTLDEIIETLLP
ncbi:MAG: hypothetical protein H8E66_30085, partial [Planctomycetes bacterium]|nr:hypothetical protein [Planctomycetota bacterium]